MICHANDAAVIQEDEIANQLPEMIGNWKAHIKVLQRVPKGARVAAAEAYCKLVDNVVDRNGIFTWAKLFGFAYVALRCPPKSPRTETNQKSLTSIVKNQINGYMATLSLPVTQTENNEDNYPNGKNSKSVKSSLAKRVAAKLADCDIKGAVRIIASDDSFAGYNEEVTAALKDKHPPAPVDTVLPPAPDDQKQPKSSSW